MLCNLISNDLNELFKIWPTHGMCYKVGQPCHVVKVGHLITAAALRLCIAAHSHIYLHIKLGLGHCLTYSMHNSECRFGTLPDLFNA